MNPQDFFTLPLVLYGLAIAELVSPWRSFFDDKSIHLPYTLTGLLLLEGAFYNFYQFYIKTPPNFESYHAFLPYLIPPLIFLIISYVYTPDKSQQPDTKNYFEKRFRLLMLLTAVFILSHFFIEMDWEKKTIARLLYGGLFMIAAISNKTFFIYIIFGMRVVSTIILLFFPEWFF